MLNVNQQRNLQIGKGKENVDNKEIEIITNLEEKTSTLPAGSVTMVSPKTMTQRTFSVFPTNPS